MIEKIDNLYAMTDKALLSIIGDYIRKIRLEQNKTQEEIALSAGITRTTLISMEKGGHGSMVTLIQILRSLGQLHLLEHFKYQPKISPLALAKQEQKIRLRSKKKSKKLNQNEHDINDDKIEW